MTVEISDGKMKFFLAEKAQHFAADKCCTAGQHYGPTVSK
jgi:hypothetical protein